VRLTGIRAGKTETEQIGVLTSKIGKVAGERLRKAIGTVNSVHEFVTTAEIGTAAIEVEIELGVPPQIATCCPGASAPPSLKGLGIFLTFRKQCLDRKCKLLGKVSTSKPFKYSNLCRGLHSAG
jgi:hypothetical protein